MSKSINVYWSAIRDDEIDLQFAIDEPISLRKELLSNRNRENSHDNFFKCPATKSVMENTFVWKSPVNSSANLKIVDNDILIKDSSDGEKKMFVWFINHMPTLDSNILIKFSYNIIFFAEEDVDVMYTAPFFSNAPHMQSGAIVPGKFNIGSWFRPFNTEFNLWKNVTSISIKEDEPLAYFTFLTDKKINLRQFRMSADAQKIAQSTVLSSKWFPNKTLVQRYDFFRRRKMRSVILKEIKDNLV